VVSLAFFAREVNMPEPNDHDSRTSSERSAVARWVLIVSGIVLVSSATVLVTMASDHSAADRAFSMLVPMIGTWIGLPVWSKYSCGATVVSE
jgi:hypothetical protein